VLIISPKRSDLGAAAFVASSADIIQVVLVKSIVEEKPLECDGELQEANIDFRVQHFDVNTPGKMNVEIALDLTLNASHQQSSNPELPRCGAQICLVFRVSYKIPTAPLPEEIGDSALENFAKLNGVTHCWPYFRHEIQHITSLLMLPTFLLPSLVIRPNSEE